MQGWTKLVEFCRQSRFNGYIDDIDDLAGPHVGRIADMPMRVSQWLFKKETGGKQLRWDKMLQRSNRVCNHHSAALPGPSPASGGNKCSVCVCVRVNCIVDIVIWMQYNMYICICTHVHNCMYALSWIYTVLYELQWHSYWSMYWLCTIRNF